MLSSVSGCSPAQRCKTQSPTLVLSGNKGGGLDSICLAPLFKFQIGSELGCKGKVLISLFPPSPNI